MRPVGSAEELAGRRKAAAKLFEKNWNANQVATAFGVSYAAAWNWRQEWRRGGVRNLAPKPRPPRARRLTRRQCHQLRNAILRGARAAGFSDDTWTCPRVQQWIKNTLDVDYHVDHLSKLLRALKLTSRFPKRRALERDDAKVENFRTVFGPLKKGARRKSASLLFLDECAFLTQPIRKRTWGAKGQKTILRVPGSRRKITVMAGIMVRPGGRLHEYFRMQRQNAKAEDILAFIVDMWKRSNRRLVVVLDNLKAHVKAAKCCEKLQLKGLEFAWLPAYAPDLNPIEGLWSSAKWGSLGNYVPPNLEALEDRVAEELVNRSNRQRFLRSLFKEAGLKL